jgi:Fic family protein
MVKDFLKAHKLMTDGLINESGKFRSGDAGVFDGNVAVHIGARPQFVPQLIEELFEWAKIAELHPILKSAIVHCEIETIHPFADGNGRMGRLWQTLILAGWNEIFAWIPMESFVNEKRPQYYDSLKNAQRKNDSGEFIEFTLSTILGAVEEQMKQIGEPAPGNSSDDKKIVVEFVNEFANEFADEFADKFADKFADEFVENDTQRLILKIMKEHPSISAKRIAEVVGITPRGVQKSIGVLKKHGLVERIGAAKGGHWLVKE